MICHSCGSQINDNLIICPCCGAVQPNKMAMDANRDNTGGQDYNGQQFDNGNQYNNGGQFNNGNQFNNGQQFDNGNQFNNGQQYYNGGQFGDVNYNPNTYRSRKLPYNKTCVVGFILSCIGMFFEGLGLLAVLLPIAGILVSVIGAANVNPRFERGKTFAQIGVIVGVIQIVMTIISLIIFFVSGSDIPDIDFTF